LRCVVLGRVLVAVIVGPELDVSILAQAASLDQLTLLAHNILDGNFSIAKDVEVVTDDVAIAATGASDERRAVVVGLLGDVVVGAVATRLAGEGELVVGHTRLGPLAFAVGDVGIVPWRGRL
jgi:hypothetical protein